MLAVYGFESECRRKYDASVFNVFVEVRHLLLPSRGAVRRVRIAAASLTTVHNTRLRGAAVTLLSRPCHAA